MTSHDVGDLVEPFAEFSNAQGEPQDPDQVTVRVRRPDGSAATYGPGGATEPPVINQPEPGRFSIRLLPGDGEHGIWYGRFVGTGQVQETVPFAFNVRQPPA